jgi:ABC-2 type transport system permease protein
LPNNNKKKGEKPMYLYRVVALIARYAFEIPRDFFRVFDLTFYPLMDIILWGFMSLWVQTGGNPETANIGTLMLLSLVLWMVVENANREIAFNLTEELYAHNLVNILVTPMQISEWLISVVILALIRVTFVFIFCSLVIWTLRCINVFALGMLLGAILPLLLLSGISLGLGISALMMRWGRRISTFIWSIPYLVLSFSAVFYPMRLLPPWAQIIGKMLPICYVFETLRTAITTGIVSWSSLGISLALNILYLAGAITLFIWMFDKSREQGLAQLENY